MRITSETYHGIQYEVETVRTASGGGKRASVPTLGFVTAICHERDADRIVRQAVYRRIQKWEREQEGRGVTS